MAHDNETGDHYVPPEAPPITIKDPITAIAIGAVLLGPLLFVFFGVFLHTWHPVVSALCALMFVGGFITLFVRAKPTNKKDEDGWDDGAVV